MSMKDCIDRAVAAGELDAERAAGARDLFEELEEAYAREGSPADAARRAARDTSIAMRHQAAEKRRRVLLQTAAAQRIEADMVAYRNLAGEPNQAAAMVAMLDRDDLATYSNMEARRKRLLGKYHSGLVEILTTFRRDLLGRTRNKATLRNVVREIFGEDTGDGPARELAKAWSDTAEIARLDFNAAGGRIPKRADWGLPQMHDSLAVRKIRFEEWRDFIEPMLDPRRMIDEATGLSFEGRSLEVALRDAFETIRTDGMSKLRPSGVPRGRAVSARRADHRFLVFRDADSWLRYQARFGNPDPFSTMMGHLDRMARDTAAMQILGPNPHATLRWMGELVERAAGIADGKAGGEKHLTRARAATVMAQDIFSAYTGTANAPVRPRLARSFAFVRSILQSAQLGSAAISAISDVAFQRMAARHAGIPAARALARTLKLMTPHVSADQKLAVRLGLIAEGWSSHALALSRYTGDVTGPEISRRIADSVLRVSGLSPWTQAGRWAFGMEFMGHLADMAPRTFDALPDATRNTLRRYGIGKQDWDVIRSTPFYEHGGARFLRPDDIIGRGDVAPSRAEHLATRLMEMIQTETEFAVPSSSLRGRAALVSDARPGTFIGEAMRSTLMYKNFAITLVATHVRRAASQATPLARARYASELVISATIMGAAALQLKEISKGRDPRSMAGDDAAAFWGAAMLQGGGMGIYGDFLFADTNRFGSGLANTLAGPVVGFADDTRRLTIGNLFQAAKGEEMNIGREGVKFAKRYTPGGSIWYLRVALERLMFERLDDLADPQASRRRRAGERRVRRETGQSYWWRPGAAAPARAPDLAQTVR